MSYFAWRRRCDALVRRHAAGEDARSAVLPAERAPVSRPALSRPAQWARAGSPPFPPPSSIRPTVRRLRRAPRLMGPGPLRSNVAAAAQGVTRGCGRRITARSLHPGSGITAGGSRLAEERPLRGAYHAAQAAHEARSRHLRPAWRVGGAGIWPDEGSPGRRTVLHARPRCVPGRVAAPCRRAQSAQAAPGVCPARGSRKPDGRKAGGWGLKCRRTGRLMPPAAGMMLQANSTRALRDGLYKSDLIDHAAIFISCANFSFWPITLHLFHFKPNYIGRQIQSICNYIYRIPIRIMCGDLYMKIARHFSSFPVVYIF
jgi:hypothetical protein